MFSLLNLLNKTKLNLNGSRFTGKIRIIFLYQSILEMDVTKLKKRLYEIVFEADTRAGRLFDETLLVMILLSVGVVMLESISGIRNTYHSELRIIEWFFTGIFTLEYLLRIWLTQKTMKYVTSFYGIIDLLAILPTYLAFFIIGGESLIVIRSLRLVRIFRILKLTRYTSAGRLMALSLWKSREKLGIFLVFVLTMNVIIGTVMYMVEGEEHGFISIPTSIYWSVVTMTTVGYGDISPVTGLGKFLSTIVMLLGYSIIAVPTGIVAAGFINKGNSNTQVCSSCLYDTHDDDALFCKKCGTQL
jgi:voltage-gated potassium channel